MATEQLAVTGIQYTDQRDWYPEPNMVARLFPNRTPFISEFFQKQTTPTPDVDYKMFQKTPHWRRQHLQINNASNEAWDASGVTAGAPTDTNTATVDGATGITVDASLEGRTCEVWSSDWTTKRGLVLVDTVNSATEVKFKSLGNPSSATEIVATLQDNDYLFVKGSAFGEVSESPEAFATDNEVVWNSLFHHRTSLEVSYDVANAAMRGVEGSKSRLGEIQTDKADEHMVQLERALFTMHRVGGTGGVAYGADSTGATTDTFDATHVPDTTDGRIRTTMGYFPLVERYGQRLDSDDDQSYFTLAKNALTYSRLVEVTEKIFQFDDDPTMPGVRTAYCGPSAYSFWSIFVLENLGTDVRISERMTNPRFGYHYKEFETPNGVLQLVKMNDWMATPYKNYMAVPTKKFCKLRRLTNSGEGTDDPGLIGYFPNIKTDNRPLKRKDEWHSHVGLDIRQVKTQCVIKLT